MKQLRECIRVEAVHAVVLSRYVKNVAPALAGDPDRRNVQRLRIHLAIDVDGRQLSERRSRSHSQESGSSPPDSDPFGRYRYAMSAPPAIARKAPPSDLPRFPNAGIASHYPTLAISLPSAADNDLQDKRYRSLTRWPLVSK